MEYEQIKEWLDKHIANLEEFNALEHFNNDIETCSRSKGIHIYKGIEIIADVMGFELKETDWGDSDYPYKYSFVYRDVEFFELSAERLGTFKGDI